MDFLGKELISTITYTDMFYDREGGKEMKINGRVFYKTGTYQAVTMVGNLYEYYDPIVERHKRFVMIGIAKQHPCDLSITKQDGYELANENAHLNPCIVMEVNKKFDVDNFRMFCEAYTQWCVDRTFVHTPKEIYQINQSKKNGQ